MQKHVDLLDFEHIGFLKAPGIPGPISVNISAGPFGRHMGDRLGKLNCASHLRFAFQRPIQMFTRKGSWRTKRFVAFWFVAGRSFEASLRLATRQASLLGTLGLLDAQAFAFQGAEASGAPIAWPPVPGASHVGGSGKAAPGNVGEIRPELWGNHICEGNVAGAGRLLGVEGNRVISEVPLVGDDTIARYVSFYVVGPLKIVCLFSL